MFGYKIVSKKEWNNLTWKVQMLSDWQDTHVKYLHVADKKGPAVMLRNSIGQYDEYPIAHAIRLLYEHLGLKVTTYPERTILEKKDVA